MLDPLSALVDLVQLPAPVAVDLNQAAMGCREQVRLVPMDHKVILVEFVVSRSAFPSLALVGSLDIPCDSKGLPSPKTMQTQRYQRNDSN